MPVGTKYVDMIGKKYGMLLGLELEHRQNEKTGLWLYWLKCRCDCGKEKAILATTIRRGVTTSCGCRRDQYDKVRGNKSKQFTGYEEIRGKTWNLIQTRAKRRKYSFNITKEQVWELYLKQNKKCALSGVDIVWGVSEKQKSTTVSIDRIDITKGYEIDNIQLVHKEINIMRNVYNIEKFKNWCKLVTEYNK